MNAHNKGDLMNNATQKLAADLNLDEAEVGHLVEEWQVDVPCFDTWADLVQEFTDEVFANFHGHIG